MAPQVLEPTTYYSPLHPINLASTTKLSTRMHDTEFTSTDVVQHFIDRQWKGEVYMQVAHDKAVASINNNRFIVDQCKASGFCGPSGATFLFNYVSRLLHIVCFANRPFFDSPRSVSTPHGQHTTLGGRAGVER